MKSLLRVITVTLSVVLIPVAPVNAAVTLIQTPTPVVTTLDKQVITVPAPISNSPGTWTIVIDNPAIASSDGLTLTLKAVGTTVIQYVQAAAGGYNESLRHSRLTINPGIPTVGVFSNRAATLSSRFITLTPPTSTSDGVWSYTSLDTSKAVISANTVSLLDGGDVTIRATQSPTQKWATASTTMVLSISAVAPLIGSFSDITLSIDSVNRVTLTLPTSNSKGGWSLTSSDPSIAYFEGYTLVAAKPGTAIVTAKQSPYEGFGSATTSMKVTIQAVSPSVQLGGFVDKTVTLDPGATQVLVIAYPTSTSTGTWTLTSSDPTIASLNGQILTALKPGKVTITAKQAAIGTFGESAPVSITVRILGKQTLLSPSSLTKLVADPTTTIVFPTSLSTGAWTATSSNSEIVSTDGKGLTFVGAGRAVISLTQAETDSYLSSTVTFEVTVIGTPPTIGAFSPLIVGVGEKLVNPVVPTSNSTGKWSFSSSDPTIVSIVDNVITGIKAGTALISAFQEPSGKYGQSQTVQTTVTVKPAPTVGNFVDYSATIGSIAPIVTPPTSNSTGTWSYLSSSPEIAVVIGGAINPLSPGTTVITATQSSTSGFTSVVRTFRITVKAAPILIPKATATAKARKITVKVTNAAGKSVAVTINGVKAKVGSNTVKAGTRKVIVKVAGKKILTKTFTIK